MIQIRREELVVLTEQIWDSMLQIPLQPIDELAALDAGTADSKTQENLSACVQIMGAWRGAVRLDCSCRFAGRTAAAFLGLSEQEVLREQMLDALGEVTNMVAGSIKPLLPGPCHISLPSVVDGFDYELNIRRGQLLLSSDFESEGEKLTVKLFEAIAPMPQ